MDLPSPGRIAVELQSVTQGHRLLLQSPLGPLVSWAPFGRFLVLHDESPFGSAATTPLSYTEDGDTYIVIASDGGSPRHPDWYLNLLADPDATVEVGGRHRRVQAETVDGEERDRLRASRRRCRRGHPRRVPGVHGTGDPGRAVNRPG